MNFYMRHVRHKMNCFLCQLSRKLISCPYCLVSFCKPCIKAYSFRTYDPLHCHECKREWDETLLAFFSKKWLSQLFKNQSLLFWEREKTYLVPYLSYQQKLDAIQEKVNEIIIHRKENHDNEYQLVRDQRQLDRYYRDELNRYQNEKKNVRIIPFEVILKCKECPGFILPSFRCYLCKKLICSDCHDKKESDHICNSKQIFKPCPSCNTPHYKIDTYDQTFCLFCHKGFSWSSGLSTPPILPELIPNFNELGKSSTRLVIKEWKNTVNRFLTIKEQPLHSYSKTRKYLYFLEQRVNQKERYSMLHYESIKTTFHYYEQLVLESIKKAVQLKLDQSKPESILHIMIYARQFIIDLYEKYPYHIKCLDPLVFQLYINELQGI